MVNPINPNNIDPSLNIEQEKLMDPSNVKGKFKEDLESNRAESLEKKTSPMDLVSDSTKLKAKGLLKAKEIKEKYGDDDPTTDFINPAARNIK